MIVKTAYRAWVEVVGDPGSMDDDTREIEVDVHMPVRENSVFALYFTRTQVVELITELSKALEAS